QARGDRDGRGTVRCRVLGDLGRKFVRALLHVGDVQDRLGGQGEERRERIGRIVGRQHGPGGAPGLEGLGQLPQPGLLGDATPRPARSWKVIVSGTTFVAPTTSDTASSRRSATGTTATLGWIVVNG